MPIPSLTSSLKHPSQSGKVEDVPATETTIPSTSMSSRDTHPARTASVHPPISSTNFHPEQVDGGKRRSFLPQRGGLKLNSHKIAPRERPEQSDPSAQDTVQSLKKSTPTAQSAPQSRLRLRSINQVNSARPEQSDGGVLPQTIRPPDATTKPSGLQRVGTSGPHAVRKTVVPSQHATSTKSNAHSRTQSTSDATAIRKDRPEPRSRLERPKSLLVAPSHSNKSASTAPTDNASSGIRNSARLASLKRSASTRSKPETTSSETVGVIHAPDTERQARTALSGSREPASEELKKQVRPAFSTLQQHFTPRKVGKPPMSTFLQPSVPHVESYALPTEIISLQADLLQLHLLHVSSGRVIQTWEGSAKRHFHSRFDEVARMYQVMRENERQELEQVNIKALRDWNSGSSPFGFVEHVQVLSGPLHELPSLVDPGGRYRRLVDEFDRWIARVDEIWGVREVGSKAQGRPLDSTEGIGDSWKAESAALVRKLTTFSRDLDRVPQPTPGSSIASIVSTCKELLGGVLEELHVMQTIEAGVVAREQEWVETQLKAIARDIGTHMEDTSSGNKAWRI